MKTTIERIVKQKIGETNAEKKLNRNLFVKKMRKKSREIEWERKSENTGEIDHFVKKATEGRQDRSIRYQEQKNRMRRRTDRQIERN